MALFDKLFSLKRRLDSENCEPRRHRGRSSQINPEQVRLLLFKECDWRGRRLLFDSSAIHKVPAGKNDKPTIRKTDETPCIVEVTNGYTYLYKGPEEDASVLGEMIFGAVAMNCKSVSLKIHIMDEPRRLMCTKVFCVPVSRRISRVERKTSDRLDTSALSASKPLNVPSLKEEGVSLSFSLDRGDSGFYGDHSPYSSASSTYDYFSMFETWDGNASQEDFSSFHSLPGRKLSTSSNGSWQRRTFQNIATRFDLGQSAHLNLPGSSTTSDSQMYSNSSTSGTSDSLASGVSMPQKKVKLGLAILITVTDSAEMDLVRRCVEHSPQIQALVCRLRLAALSAGAGAFVSTLHNAAENAARWLSDLIYGPRLQPMWLSLVTQEPRASHKLADSLLTDLCSVLAVGDTKTTHFFISTLLTHVLTYHLGWVTTVSPYDTVEHRPPPSEAKPYNALWAQLSDLCGSIGFPPRAARTILSGEKNQQFINRLLLVLTYFVRCGDVTKSVFQYQDCVIKEVKTVSVNTVSGFEMNKLDCNLPVNTQNSDSSVSTLIASDVSFKRSTTQANLSQKLSISSEVGSSTGEKSTGLLRRNPTMMHSMKSASDSSLNSTASDETVSDQKVLFVLGDDEKLVGLKNKSNGGKMVKKSSKVHDEPVSLEECVKPSCDKAKNPESPSKCCGQTLQHSKPIKHSGFKFEFDKYPQIVTNYMKSKNLEILDRHYIGKPGNLKLDNFQFDPTVVPAIQEERCETCVKCQMEATLQTPTNASEMEYMNDMPRALEPQYAQQKVVTELDNKREMSPKTFVRKRKHNTVVVNLVNIKSVSDGEVNVEGKDFGKDLKTIPIIRTPDSLENTNTNSTEDEATKLSTIKSRHKSNFLLSSKLKSTKSLGNLNLLASEGDTTEADADCDLRVLSHETLNTSQNNVKSNSLNEMKPISPDDLNVSSNESMTFVTSLSDMHNTISPIEKTVLLSQETLPLVTKTYTNEDRIQISSQDSITTESLIDDGTKSTHKKSTYPPEKKTVLSEADQPTFQSNKIQTSEKSTTSELLSDKSSNLSENSTISSETSPKLKPTFLELKMPDPRRISRDVLKTFEVKRVIEFPLPKIISTEDTTQKSGFDRSLLGGVTDHYVPDLVLQGTMAKPIMWESELRRDLDLTSYLNKTMDAPIQAVAIIGDTNTWEVRVVGRDCGTGGMSSLVGAMLDALPAMWKAKVPAHQCLSFLESKLREFCVLSKTLADMLMSTDFCDIATLTKSLNIDVNDVPLLLAVATTHTPQVATRYGLSYR